MDIQRWIDVALAAWMFFTCVFLTWASREWGRAVERANKELDLIEMRRMGLARGVIGGQQGRACPERDEDDDEEEGDDEPHAS